VKVSVSTVESAFTVVPDRSSKEEICFVCPEKRCGDKSGNRSVSVKTGLTNCWRCGIAGDFYKWAHGLGIEIEPDEDATASLDAAVHELDEALSDKRKKAVYAVEVPLPKGFRLVADHPKAYESKRIKRMAERKRLTFEDMVSADVGFTTDREWGDYAIFPVTEWGRPVYYQGRTYDDPDHGSTKKFPSRSVCPLGSRHWVYGIDEARNARVVIAVESILNVLSLRRELAAQRVTDVAPVAVFKHKISAEQAIKISGLRQMEELCLMFDEDAITDSYKEVLNSDRLQRVSKSVVEMPKGVDANDDAMLAVKLWRRRKPARRDASDIRILERMLEKKVL